MPTRTGRRSRPQIRLWRRRGGRVEIGLVRDRHHDIDKELLDRQWAYLEAGKLPERFDDGAAIPQRFRAEVSAVTR
jgi:hypothetical protein